MLEEWYMSMSAIDFLSSCHTHLQSPVWLSLVTERERQRAVCMQFMEELGSAIMELETKDTK